MKKFLAVVITTSLILSLIGCGKTEQSDQSPNTDDVAEAISKETITVNNDSLFSKLETGFKSASLEEEYESPMYQLDEDYVFEFDASEASSSIAFKAFSVYDNANFDSNTSISEAKCTYENGKIYVAPRSVLVINPDGSRIEENGTWGSLNKLYLVQNIDLQTGEELANPIVTPFSIKHDLDAPVVNQGVNENNLYTLSWSPINGATEYHVYECHGSNYYELEGITTSTSISVEEFESQKKSENYDSLVKNDLENWGYTVDRSGYEFMNTGAEFSNENNDGYFVVVAFDGSGKQSGISNIVDVREVANKLPRHIADNINITIQDITDVPAYVDVEMIDGSIVQMLINYHGAEVFRFEDDPNKTLIKAHVCNTLFDNFPIEIHGMNHDDFLAQSSKITERQDSLNKTGGSSEPTVSIPSAPSNDTTDADETAKQEVVEIVDENTPSTDTQKPDESKLVVTPDGYTTYDLYVSATQEVENRLAKIGDVDDILYANNKLEAWIGYCMIAQMDVIPVPVCVFPEASNEEYLARITLEAYRQNPTSGIMANLGFSYDYESLVVQYVEDPNTRLNKTVKELQKAKELAGSIVSSDMSDTDKIVAINNYLCENASYDMDSSATDVDMNNLSEQFIDAHTPYGILINNYGVCESYSEAFALIGRYAGLDVVMEIGTLQGGGHEWNRVNADGSWCVVDVTNNDTDFVSNALLNVTEDQIKGILIPDKSAYMSDLSATDGTKEYYYLNNKYASTASEAINILESQIKSGNVASVRLPAGTSQDSAVEVARRVVQETGEPVQNAVYFANVLALNK